MLFDLDQARRETPGCKHVTHLNNAGAALMPQPVLHTQISHLELEATIGGYEAAEREQDRIEAVYDSIAQLINCHRDEIAIVENATVGWDMAFYAIPLAEGDRILTAEAEYGANFVAYLQQAKRTGAVIDVIPSTPDGEICLESLKQMIDDRVKLISITHVPTNGGLVNPATEVGRIAREHGILYLLDACQTVGQMPINIAEIQCDMLSATGRKFLRGPRGSGFLYVRRDLIADLEPPMLDHYAAKWMAPDRYEMQSNARRFENWENNYAAKLGLGVAADYALSWGLDRTWQRCLALATQLRDGLAAIPGASLRDIGQQQCAITTFTLAGHDPFQVKQILNSQDINVSVSGPNSTLLDAQKRDLPPLIRASVHYYNSEEEIDRFLRAVGSLNT
ncbi:aminotransferase class V-fold PLP-dependent enzyme [Aestuariispira insulae]|uniref:Selenocysteine lyase/cysteine desulfurase n=1 Tax=Aestuariispira insulae TaxID=1461337 RepID=A0A3D9HXR8_9PROT|nr:aminotransferase class V-fold PLP-dependent enzyme [Aestuariispira insulae]RED53696.1 selenocysteine lyase/cysteine desulfurase [Aestuariispira insulae]